MLLLLAMAISHSGEVVAIADGINDTASNIRMEKSKLEVNWVMIYLKIFLALNLSL